MKTTFDVKQDDEQGIIPVIVENQENKTNINLCYGWSWDGDESNKGEKLLSGFEILDVFQDIGDTKDVLKQIFPTTYKEVFDGIIEIAERYRLY